MGAAPLVVSLEMPDEERPLVGHLQKKLRDLDDYAREFSDAAALLQEMRVRIRAASADGIGTSCGILTRH